MASRRFTVFVLSALIATRAAGSFISISSDPSVSVEDGQVTAALTLKNFGDEPAYELCMDACCADASGSSETISSLQPFEEVYLKARLGDVPVPGGIYTTVYSVHYKDSGGKSYSALNAIPLVTDLEAPPKDMVNLAVDNVEINRRGSVMVRAAATTNIPQCQLTIFLPDEIRCRDNSLTMDFSSDPAEIEFKVRNRGANPGSIYVAIIVCDYVIDGVHLSTVIPMNIAVSPNASVAQSPWMRVLLVFLAALAVAFQVPSVRKQLKLSTKSLGYIETACFLLSLITVEVFLVWQLHPEFLLKNTTAVGGDTPAHNYMFSHLKETLLHHGRIISWGGGWWCGFPMFQFYFTLPYLCMVLLNLLLPFNIAFKLVSISGIILLPPAAWFMARQMKLPKPIPAVVALSMVPLLYDHTHVMWGVNIYSTLSGMIANSLSFALMLLFLSSAWQDCEKARFRTRTVLLLTLVLSSHFFTSIISLGTAVLMPFLRKKKSILKALLLLGAEVALACLIMAWWLVPLLAKLQYTADFGTNWPNIDFLDQLLGIALKMSPLLIPALVMAILKKAPVVILFFWMLGVSMLLFIFGFHYISHVFVNIRLWPFIVFSLLALEAIGLGYLLSFLPAPRAALLPLTCLVLIYGIDAPNHVRDWAEWNFAGLETKEHYSVFEKLVLPLKGTPGRLANDLCDENNMLGSSRIFELAPHLADKPVLEGGIVNSAAGSMFSYYIQSETSQNCAGFPTNVKPTTFNMINGTVHLELFNVKHFIARWEGTRSALKVHKDWRFIGREEEWELFELTSHDGCPVFVPEYMPIAVHTHPELMDWKTAGLEWIYNIASISNFFVILPEKDSTPDELQTVQTSKYLTMMEAKDRGMIEALNPRKLPSADIQILKDDDFELAFTTTRPGIPHIIKTTWYPNWRSTNGERIYMVTPCFMMIIPEKQTTRLVYARTGADIAAVSLSWTGVIILLALSARSLLNRKSNS